VEVELGPDADIFFLDVAHVAGLCTAGNVVNPDHRGRRRYIRGDPARIDSRGRAQAGTEARHARHEVARGRDAGDIVDAVVIQVTVEEAGIAHPGTGRVLPPELGRIEAELFPAQAAADRERVVEVELDTAHYGVEGVIDSLGTIPDLRERELAGVV